MTRRLCAICKRGSAAGRISDVGTILQAMEIRGRYAHPKCILRLQKQMINLFQKRGKLRLKGG